jgi:hypothetical protein
MYRVMSNIFEFINDSDADGEVVVLMKRGAERNENRSRFWSHPLSPLSPVSLVSLVRFFSLVNGAR